MEELASSFFAFLNFVFILCLSLGIAGLGSVLLYFAYTKWSFGKKLAAHMAKKEHTILLIRMSPRSEQKEAAMAEFFQTLHRVLPNNTHISLEMVASDQFLRFYLVIPSGGKSIVESQLYAQFPEAEIEEVKDYLPNYFEKNTAFAELSFKKSSLFPLNTFQAMEEDILKNISAVFSKTEKNEVVIIQLALRRIGGKHWERGFKASQFHYFGQKQIGETPHPMHYKLEQDLFAGKLRFAFIASSKATAESKLNTLLSLYKPMKSGYNEFKIKKLTHTQHLEKLFHTRLFESGDLWTIAEIATLYHFPSKGNVVSNVVHTTSKRAPAPDILPREGLVNPKDVTFIGETNYRNDKQKFGILREDRRRHLYVVGKTGSGKSRLLELLLIADIQQGQGCCLIDPHGDLADEVLKYVPKNRINDVVYVNPADVDFPIGFNPLEPVEDYEVRQHLSRFFIAIFKKLFASEWNPRMEHLIRYITLALLETPDSNILGIPRILSDTSYRQRVIQQIKDPVVKSFWTTDFSASNEQFISAAAVPIMNKVGQFISNPVIRNMVGQRENMLNFDEFMNKGKIVIINLSKGKLGDDNAALLGSMFITKIQQAALARAKMPEDERRDFYFYVDEFQNFATDAFSSILSEARKYHLDLTIAHQYIAQLPDDVKATAFGNVGSMIVFAVGGDDAAYLEKEFAPTFSADDLINLNTREMYFKMSVNGKLTPPFSARTIDVPRPTTDFSAEIINRSQLTYGRNRVAVENEIKRWSESTDYVGSGAKNDFPEPIV